jgi:hypothetical protein
LLTLRNTLHDIVVDAVALGNSNLLMTTWWVTDVALSGVLLWCGAFSGEVARTTAVEADVAGGGSSSRCHRQAQHRQRWR